MNVQLWHRPATIERNNFKLKSLSCWSYNVAIGCAHKCRFCYVPEVSTNRMATKLEAVGVTDPDSQWGDYVFPRTWDRQAFLASLRKAEATPANELNADGNRAVMLCTTTDPYQTLRSATSHTSQSGHPINTMVLDDWTKTEPVFDPNSQMTTLVREALELILTKSTLRVRLLTRSPLARRDFDLMKLFGERLMFGMSLPTLNNQLARIYEPNAPAPSQRLDTLRRAQAEGIPVFVAVAPVYPECNYGDMLNTLRAVQELNPVTVFMEPINIRAENVARIEAHYHSLSALGGAATANMAVAPIKLNTAVFATKESWAKYAFEQMDLFQQAAREIGISPNVLHLWPDKSLERLATGPQKAWLHQHWNKISAWPTI